VLPDLQQPKAPAYLQDCKPKCKALAVDCNSLLHIVMWPWLRPLPGPKCWPQFELPAAALGQLHSCHE